MVVVYFTDGGTAAQQSAAVGIFGDDYFTIASTTHRCPEPKTTRDFLQRAKDDYPTEPVILVKPNIITALDSEAIARIVQKTLTRSFTVCYLCKWSDKCHLYTDRERVDGGTSVSRPSAAATDGSSGGVTKVTPPGVSIVSCFSPQGEQAMLFTPAGRDQVLGLSGQDETIPELIAERKIKAKCLVPNIVSVDTVYSTNNEDFFHTQECEIPESFKTKDNSFRGSACCAILFVLLLLIFIVWLLIRYGDRRRCC